ncbi:TPA: hypothetical protein ACKP8A_004442 [Stenotrophomonas maltophilia]
MLVDTFGAYVRAELEHWGREFALHREYDYFGSHSKNLLAVLIDNKGDLLGRSQGCKPLESDGRAQLVENVVAGIARHDIAMACALRAYHCGTGRRKVKRFETALLLMARSGQPPVSNRQYLSLVVLGQQRVRGWFEGASMTA